MLDTVTTFIVNTVGGLGYWGIFIMMFLESSFFPFPSEVVMIPAGYLSYKGDMDISMAIFAAIMGSLAGAFLNYYIALIFGRNFLLRYGKYILFDKRKIDSMDKFFKKHGHISTFSGRLIPVVRQYISFPAGLSKMNIYIFSLFTVLGAGIWVTILASIGYFVGANEELAKGYIHSALGYIILFLIVIVAIYAKMQKSRRKE